MKLTLPILVIKTIEVLEKAGFETHVVGGPIRDMLTGKPVTNWDFTSKATPEQIQKIFPESFYDNRFGTVGITAEELVNQFKLKNYPLKKVHLTKESVFEITTFRTEGKYSDKRRPDKVSWGETLKEDLKRRDFTINAMALTTDTKIIDPFKGREDLKNKIVRAVGDPNKRFDEDALRMMRAIRIAAQLGLTIEEATLKAINRQAKNLQYVSQERIRDELLKILVSDYPTDGIKLLYTSNLLTHVLPELIPMRQVKQAGHHTKDVWNHSLDALAACPSPNPIVKLATLLHDVGKPIAYRQIKGKITFYGHEVVGARIVNKIAKRLHLSKKDGQLLWTLVRYHMFAYDPKMTDAAIRRFITRVGLININEMIMLRIGDRVGGGSQATSWRLREFQERIGQVLYTPMQITDLKVNGRDIMKTLKIKSSPKVGKVLKKLFEEVIEDSQKNERKYLLGKIKKIG